MAHMIETNLARELARKRHAFCRVGADGKSLVFYVGEEAEPGTWVEIGRTMLDESSGACFVSRNAVDLILA